MEVRIETIAEKKLLGTRARMSLSDNKTVTLWQAFMSRRKEIENTVGRVLFSVEVYDVVPDFSLFTPDTQFEKWAAVEVSDDAAVPDGLETFSLQGGLYAVFLYKGPASAFAGAFQYIFREWLPSSNYVVDSRPHFEVMGEKYKGNDPASEEEIWVPVRMK